MSEDRKKRGLRVDFPPGLDAKAIREDGSRIQEDAAEEKKKVCLLEMAKTWSLFRDALGQSCDLTEKEFKRLTVPVRLERLVAVVGMEPLGTEINDTLQRLNVGYTNGGDGLSCGIQRHGGVTLGWCPYADEDPTFLPMNPFRFLPALVRLEERLKGEPDYWDVHRRVRRLCTRTR